MWVCGLVRVFSGRVVMGVCVTPHASVVHISGTGQLQANPLVESQRLAPGKPTRRTMTTMRSIDLVICDDHLSRLSCQRYYRLMMRLDSPS